MKLKATSPQEEPIMISAKNAEILTAVLKMLSIGITANEDKKSYSLLR